MKLLNAHRIEEPKIVRRKEAQLMALFAGTFFGIAAIIVILGLSSERDEGTTSFFIGMSLFYSSLGGVIIVVALSKGSGYKVRYTYGLNEDEGATWVDRGGFEEELEHSMRDARVSYQKSRPRDYITIYLLEGNLTLRIERKQTSVFSPPDYPYVVTVTLDGIEEINFQKAKQLWEFLELTE